MVSSAARPVGAAASLALLALGCLAPDDPAADARRFRLPEPPPAGFARVVMFHVGAGEGAPERVAVNGRELATLSRGRTGLRDTCEYAFTTVAAGPVRVESTLAGAFAGGLGTPAPASLDFDARAGARHYVRLRSETAATAGSPPNRPGPLPVHVAGRHSLELAPGESPPADLEPCLLPTAPSDAASYDQRVLDAVIACLDNDARAPVEPFARGVCDCWARFQTEVFEPLSIRVSVDAAGRATAVAAEPESGMARCARGAPVGAELPAPPSGPRDVTIRLRPG